MKKTIAMLALCTLLASSVAKAGDAEQAERRFREALINYKQNASFGANAESVSFDLTLLRQADTAAHTYKLASQSSDSCMLALVEPVEELNDAAFAFYQAILNRDMAGVAP